jgi:hypothetical protein
MVGRDLLLGLEIPPVEHQAQNSVMKDRGALTEVVKTKIVVHFIRHGLSP